MLDRNGVCHDDQWFMFVLQGECKAANVSPSESAACVNCWQEPFVFSHVKISFDMVERMLGNFRLIGSPVGMRLSLFIVLIINTSNRTR